MGIVIAFLPAGVAGLLLVWLLRRKELESKLKTVAVKSRCRR